MEALLKRRTVEAQDTAEVYLFVAEFLQLVADNHFFQVCDVPLRNCALQVCELFVSLLPLYLYSGLVTVQSRR